MKACLLIHVLVEISVFKVVILVRQHNFFHFFTAENTVILNNSNNIIFGDLFIESFLWQVMDCKFASAASDMWGVGVITYLLGNKNSKKLPNVVFAFGSLIIIEQELVKRTTQFCCCYLI